MESLLAFVKPLLEFLKHPDTVLENFLQANGSLSTYAFLFAIVFVETGLVIMPFLPGDSLLFAVGALAANEKLAQYLNIAVIYPLFITAALLGDNVNYWIGRKLGRKLFASETSKVFNRNHLSKTEGFFARHGGRAIILARFVPIVRTFAPFVAGMGNMSYARFLGFSVAGALIWVGVCVTLGYILGNIPIFKHNFEKMVYAVIGISLLPIVFEVVKHRMEAKGDRSQKSEVSSQKGEGQSTSGVG
jgi:membrane-associated protein